MSLRLLIVSDTSPLLIEGGAERVLWELACRLAKRGHRVRILSRASSEKAPAAVDRQGVQIRHFRVEQTSHLRFLLDSVAAARDALGQALKEEPADVLHCHQPFSGLGALAARAAKGIPALYTFHSPAPLEYRLRRGMTRWHRPGIVGLSAQALLWGVERACVRRATRIHVLSGYSRDILWRLYRIAGQRVATIPGGADLRRFHPVPNRVEVRRALGLPETRPLLLTVRNLEARMGLDALIRATALVREAFPGLLVIIGGSGSLRQPLESLTISLGLEAHVRFVGYVPESDLPRFYQAADAFVLPTRALEGFGLITVEALACGTPVLGTPVGATPEILAPLDPSLLFDSASAEDMAEGVRGFLSAWEAGPRGQEWVRAACREYAEARYDWESAVNRLETVLTKLGSDAGGAG